MRNVWTVVVMCLMLGLGTLSACEAGTASCQEECEESGDCKSGLMCRSGECVPEECEACSGTCAFTENTAAQEQGEEAECDFSECR